MSDDVHCDVQGGLARFRLDRPWALNALTIPIIREMDRMLRQWETDPSVKAVLIEGVGEKVFCAGGDIRVLSDAAKSGDYEIIRRFFWSEYTLNRLIKKYRKPYLAILNGITMGGGVGISVHGSHRIVSENTVFAMPETGIGMFPDVGGTWVLPRCPGQIGTYLALTGARLRAADCVYAGIATHNVATERLYELEIAIGEAVSSSEGESAVMQAITGILELYHDEDPDPPLAALRADIDRVFGLDSIEAMLEALDAMGPGWGADTAAVLRSKSPTSLKVALRQMRAGPLLTFDRAMQIEYRIAQRIVCSPDFAEGVRAVIVDKDGAPTWSPSTLEEVSEESVRAFFAPLAEVDELEFD
jgi:enoyl-CoA hydratase